MDSKKEILQAEADWLLSAVSNAQTNYPGRYSAEYLAGFMSAAGWVQLHANMERDVVEEEFDHLQIPTFVRQEVENG